MVVLLNFIISVLRCSHTFKLFSSLEGSAVQNVMCKVGQVTTDPLKIEMKWQKRKHDPFTLLFVFLVCLVCSDFRHGRSAYGTKQCFSMSSVLLGQRH